MSEGNFSTFDGLQLYYQVSGDEGAETLVVPAASELIDDLEPLKVERRVIAYDPRGRGRSQPDPNPTSLWTDYEPRDLEALRQHFALERFQLLGWSYLGGVAALYAAQHPERVSRLVLMSSIPARFPAPYDQPEEEARKALSRIPVEGVERLKQLQLLGIDQSDPEGYCRAVKEVLLLRQAGNPAALRYRKSDPCRFPNEWLETLNVHMQSHFPAESWQRDWRSVAESIRATTLVIHGSEDLVPVDAAIEWASIIADARLLVLTGAGHFPHLEAPEKFLTAVDWFLWGGWPEDAHPVSEAWQEP